MLSAFTARPIVELKQRDKSRIESILNYGDRLLIGLNTGSLRIYRVNEIQEDASAPDAEPATSDRSSSQPISKPVELLREQEKFSKSKIEQLAIIKEANILISLSNGHVSIHDLQTYELHEVLTKTKGATAFAVTSNIVKDPATGIPSIVSRLAVAVKRRLLLWSWQDMELASDTSEYTLVTGIKTLTWATGTRLIAGLSSSYVMVDVETSEITEIVGPGSIGGAPGQDGGRFGGLGVASVSYMGIGGSAPKPLATRLGEGEMLLAKDINTLFIDTDGKSLGRRQIPWAVAPDAVGYSYPYLLALQASRGTLEVRNPQSLNLLQSIPLPNAGQLHVPQPNVSLAHAGKGFLVSSDRCVWRMCALDYDSQIDALVERGKLDEAINLLGMLEDALLKDKEGRLREVKMLKAQRLFDQRKYRDSLDLFTEVSAPPERVIRLYPRLIAGDLSTIEDISESPTGSIPGDQNAEDVDTANQSKQSSGSGEESHHTSDADAQANGRMDSADTASIWHFRKADVTDRSDAATMKGQPLDTPALGKTLEGKDLRAATLELQAFLVSARTKLQRFLNKDGTLKGTPDTTGAGHDGVAEPAFESLLVQKSQGLNQDRKEQLRETAKLVDTTLFRAYMFASPSLAGPLFRLDNFCDPDVVGEKLLETGRYNDLIDFFFGKRLHRKALELLKKFGQADEKDEIAPQLHGPQRTVAYLQNLPPEMIDLILEFVEWPLRQDPDLGMEVFLADSENAETLPRLPVLEFLQRINKELALKYLEHIVHELNDTTPDFHQRLVNMYLEGLQYKDFKSDVERTAWKQKLLDFLRNSRHYQAYKVLGQLSRDDPDLYEARAIILSNMGQHKQALDIYVFKLKDPDKAEEYCNQVFLTEQIRPAAPTQPRHALTSDPEDATPSIYHTLLSLYLTPPPPYQPQWEPALTILAKHGSRLPASSTLDLIPEVLPIKKLESYFRGRIRSANTFVNEGRVSVGLRKSIVVREQATLLLGDGLPGGSGGRNRRVVISEDRVCGVCYKRFGNSAIKVLPNNAVVHYGCSNR
ncbi:MAG: vacuolar morphogenesis [Lasallia pustulata]|uniref:Vacuolar morphogenesis n=1 Tax=Lasallia pustulata TaxID=136370 RepID=A0A5M8PZK1_9LECA|nr:MAG: vacuolar morphogenesis [Lasallia pustulata]